MRAYQDSQGYWDEQTDVDDEQDGMETIYVYMTREKPGSAAQDELLEQGGLEEGNRWTHVQQWIMGTLAMLLLSGFCLIPESPMYVTRTISVPAIPLPLVVLTAHVQILPTGMTTIPARQAHGVLTVYNGSSLIEHLPAGFVVTSSSGPEIATDAAVTIPANNPPTDGIATVTAHAVIAGTAGNIEASSVNQEDGTSLVIKNLAAFTGGRDASSSRYLTSADVNNALAVARAQLATQKSIGLLPRPCMESQSQQANTLSVTWRCQYVTYHAPAGVKVLSVRVAGNTLVLTIRVAEVPR